MNDNCLSHYVRNLVVKLDTNLLEGRKGAIVVIEITDYRFSLQFFEYVNILRRCSYRF